MKRNNNLPFDWFACDFLRTHVTRLTISMPTGRRDEHLFVLLTLPVIHMTRWIFTRVYVCEAQEAYYRAGLCVCMRVRVCVYVCVKDGSTSG